MAFGRSNSLSLNTGAANSLFAANTPAPSNSNSTGLFGSSTTAAASQPQQSTGLFGAAPSTSSSQPQHSTSLFGGGTAAQPPKPTLSLFGATPTSSSNSTQPQQQIQQQQQQSGGLFGGATANNTSSTGAMFGQSQNNNSLFGSAPNPSATLFGASQSNNNNNNNFGSSVLNPLGSSNVRPLAGSLTMGQGNPSPNNTQPGVKIDLSNLRPTTRFSDLHDDLKKTIESIDSFIRQQESYASQCEGLIGGHSAAVESIKPDVELIQNQIETVELALENDGAAIDNAKELVQRDASDLIRVARMAENLGLPQQYHYGRSSRPTATDDDYDIDLVRYFGKQAEIMQQTLDTYTSHLAEIEAHLRVVEASTVQQAHQLAAQRAGGRAGNSADNVRELAETLRGFESGILGAAGLVGSCREGVNELILGKIGGDARESIGYGGRRSVKF